MAAAHAFGIVAPIPLGLIGCVIGTLTYLSLHLCRVPVVQMGGGIWQHLQLQGDVRGQNLHKRTRIHQGAFVPVWMHICKLPIPLRMQLLLATDFPHYEKGPLLSSQLSTLLGVGVFNSDGA